METRRIGWDVLQECLEAQRADGIPEVAWERSQGPRLRRTGEWVEGSASADCPRN